MKKIKLFLLFGLILPGFLQAQSIPSPDKFLGYELGSRFTYWHNVVSYFELVARMAPDYVKLTNYGTTYEGRPMIIATVSSPANMKNLDAIQTEQLAVAGINGKQPTGMKLPSIVWMSYNVHGNEGSSTEVSMLMLYNLVTNNHPNAHKWLENTVVIIDPCLNPDGRDFYVNWYQSVMGKRPNASMQAREHYEPQYKGRANHYNHDLNRDWVWQTQIETEQRLKVYHTWMPMIHVDFHEQFYNSPYYFAPAAEPMHEAITPFQRQFQEVIGKNNAKYFDQNGWDYFTKEYFDLLYPSYGDTYPLYNGAIGMTYEQAGHSMGGVAITWGTGDTLTLKDRIAHHYTTGMSTIEVASQNQDVLTKSFKQYFDDARTKGSGVYKTYVVDGSNPGKTKALLDLLKKNNIDFSLVDKTTAVKGFDYFEGKEKAGQIKSGDIIIPALQSKSTLVRVLFEPKTYLSDSLTYDITAWALPYVYGMPAIALKESIKGVKHVTAGPAFILPENVYGYIIPYRSFREAQFLSALIQSGVKVRYHEKGFTTNGKKYAPGTLIILTHQNKDKIEVIKSLTGKFDIRPEVLTTGYMEAGGDIGSSQVLTVNTPRIAMMAGEQSGLNAVGELWYYFDQQLDYPLTMINTDRPDRIDFEHFDVLIVPSGRQRALADKDGNKKLKAWLQNGGRLIVIENAVSMMAQGEWGIEKISNNQKQEENKVRKYGDRLVESLEGSVAGVIYKVDLDHSHPLAFGYEGGYFALRNSATQYEYLRDGWNVGVVKPNNVIAGWMSSTLQTTLENNLAIGTHDYGRGQIIYFIDNPLFRSFWENGKLLLSNALFFKW